LYNYINPFYPIQDIIVERPLRGSVLAKKRLKKLGFFKVAGQVLFSILIVPVLNFSSKKRIREIKDLYKVDETEIPETKKNRISSVNDDKCIKIIAEINPDIVLVNGTRIISRRLLESTKAIFINMHTGITPMYRGVHGGYWAMVNNDKEHCGVTIHLVDKGIDTGTILYQVKIPSGKRDNFVTYPFLQFGEGMALVKKAIDDISVNNLNPAPVAGAFSKLWYHPTALQYLYYRIFRGIK
jgi:methionyl-tRNA formyltransferase